MFPRVAEIESEGKKTKERETNKSLSQTLVSSLMWVPSDKHPDAEINRNKWSLLLSAVCTRVQLFLFLFLSSNELRCAWKYESHLIRMLCFTAEIESEVYFTIINLNVFVVFTASQKFRTVSDYPITLLDPGKTVRSYENSVGLLLTNLSPSFPCLVVFLVLSQLSILWHLTPLFLIISYKQVRGIIVAPVPDNDVLWGKWEQRACISSRKNEKFTAMLVTQWGYT